MERGNKNRAKDIIRRGEVFAIILSSVLKIGIPLTWIKSAISVIMESRRMVLDVSTGRSINLIDTMMEKIIIKIETGIYKIPKPVK